MNHFVPPYPPRPRQPLGPLAILRTARRNLLAVFEEKSFEYQFFGVRVLNRMLFLFGLEEASDKRQNELIQSGQQILEQLGRQLGLIHHLIQPRFKSPFHDKLLSYESP